MNSTHIYLNYNFGYKWFKRENIIVKGWIFDESGNSFQNEQLLDYFSGIDSTEKLKNVLSKANGHFAMILETPYCLIAATDRGRSFPLYFRTDKGFPEISDSGFSLIHQNDKGSYLNDFSLQEYLAAGHVTGNKTLLKNVSQLGAGELVIFSDRGVEISSYFQFLPDVNWSESFEKSVDQFVEILEKDYQNIIKALNGRTVVIPLSAGYDSRSIASMFKRLGYQNVICYSFGQDGSPEMTTSKKVAETLGYKWFFIETTPEIVRDFAESDEFLQYVDFAANASSFYIIQDFFAIRKIRKEGLIPADSIFMPGHSGDTLGGSNFLELFSGKESAEQMINKIIEHRFDLNKISKETIELIRENLVKQFNNSFDPSLWFDYWCMKEWNPKMFANGIRVYDFFGYNYLLPLWSKNLLSFFSNLPLEFRIGKELYEYSLETRIFEPLGVNLTPNRRKIFKNRISLYQKFKKFVKGILPQSYVYKNFRYDPINAKLYTTELYKNMKNKGVSLKYNGTNSVKAQWYVRYIEQKYRLS
ncbi:MAG: asparagine synthase-related protein [Tenuifilaceae bacterium]